MRPNLISEIFLPKISAKNPSCFGRSLFAIVAETESSVIRPKQAFLAESCSFCQIFRKKWAYLGDYIFVELDIYGRNCRIFGRNSNFWLKLPDSPEPNWFSRIFGFGSVSVIFFCRISVSAETEKALSVAHYRKETTKKMENLHCIPRCHGILCSKRVDIALRNDQSTNELLFRCKRRLFWAIDTCTIQRLFIKQFFN